MPRTTLALVAALVLVAGACGGEDQSATTTTTTTTTTTMTTEAPSTATTTARPDPTATWSRCDDPDGFSISFPDGWSTNDGSVVSACSRFDPEPFTVPEQSDARVAAIVADVESVPFHQAAAPGDERDRAVTAVDGHQAVRVVDPGSALYGPDTEATRYLIDLSIGVDDGPGTLVVDTVDLPGSNYDANVETLDRMVQTIDLTVADESPPGIVARYGGGGTPFAASAELQDGRPCVTVPVEGSPSTTCFSTPGPASLRLADLGTELLPAVGGVAGDDVFRVDAELDSGSLSFLPVRIGDSTTRGWVVPVDPTEVSSLTFSTIDGTELGSRDPAEEVAVQPVGSFGSPPVSSADFPADGAPALLRDVRVAAHEDFDRVVFEFTGAANLSYRVEDADSVSGASGKPIDVGGSALVQVTISPAAGVDLSGTQPEQTYTGPDHVSAPGTATVTEVVEVEDFESTLTWAIGTRSTAAVAVDVLSDPSRLVVDLRS